LGKKGGITLKIYLDSCALSRPYDDYLNEEIIRDAKSVEAIFELIDAGKAILVDSRILEFEAKAIKDAEKKAKVNTARKKANLYVELTPEIKERASEFMIYGIELMDALHLAAAEREADIFITTDKRLLKKAKKIPNLKMKVFSLLEFWRYYDNQRNRKN